MQLLRPESKGCQQLSLFLTLWDHKLTSMWCSQRCVFCTLWEADGYLLFLYLIPLRDIGNCCWISLCPFFLIWGSSPCSLSSCQSFLKFQAALWFRQYFAKVWFCLVFFKLIFLTWAKCPMKLHFNELGSWWYATLCAMNHSFLPAKFFWEFYIHKFPLIFHSLNHRI